MQRYIIINANQPPVFTDWYDPENNLPADGAEQTVIDLATGKYLQNFGPDDGEWVEMGTDNL